MTTVLTKAFPQEMPPVPKAVPDKKRVLIVGGGFAGIAAARGLKRADVEITLIDRRNHHIFQPLLYQAATAILPPSQVAWPIRQLVRANTQVTTVLSEVTAVDAPARRVHLADGAALAYDTLVLATGVTHAYFGHDDWAPFAPGLKSLDDATQIRRRILLAFERAEASPAEAETLLTFVIVGAGPTGVELAGIIAELARTHLPEEFRNVDTRRARIVLLEAGERILPAFDPSLSAYARAAGGPLAGHARSDGSWPSRHLCHRRHRRRALARGNHGSGTRPGREAAGRLCSPGHSRPPERTAFAPAVPISP